MNLLGEDLQQDLPWELFKCCHSGRSSKLLEVGAIGFGGCKFWRTLLSNGFGCRRVVGVVTVEVLQAGKIGLFAARHGRQKSALDQARTMSPSGS